MALTVLVLAPMFCTTCVKGLPPVLAHRPTVLAEKLMSYAKLYLSDLW